MLQATPYVFALFIVPMHYFTHVLLLFMTGVFESEMHEGDREWSECLCVQRCGRRIFMIASTAKQIQ